MVTFKTTLDDANTKENGGSNSNKKETSGSDEWQQYHLQRRVFV